MTITLALLHRLEQLEGPDRGVDWEIHCLSGLDGVGMYGNHPSYTASIDDALSNVGLHKVCIERWYGDGDKTLHAIVDLEVCYTDSIMNYEGRASGPNAEARALTIAICRARLEHGSFGNG